MNSSKQRGTGQASLLLSIALVVLVATAIAGWDSALFIAIVASAIFPGFLLQKMFPSSRMLWIAFANLVAAYASVFAVFLEEAFVMVTPLTVSVGFTLPIVSFLAGCWMEHERVRSAITDSTLTGERGLQGSLLWLPPVAMVGAAVIAISQIMPGALNGETVFIVAMLMISVIVLTVSSSVAVFLVEVTFLFEEFSRRVSHLLVPAGAFLTAYAVIVVAFAAIYTIASKVGLQDHFRVAGVVRAVSFPEALHFSITTLSTVGYGDIVPASITGRSLAAIQVIIGTLLLLFGVSEILEYSRERRKQNMKEPK